MTNPAVNTHALTVEALREAGKPAIARALTIIEKHPGRTDVVTLLDAAWRAAKAHVIGLTGPPGVGKSTLIDVLIRRFRGAGETVAVIAVDPSSRSTGGALLGDRTRFQNNPDDDGIFVRSLAARGQLGGLADLAFPSVVLLAALYDRVLVETVGVGQSEADVSGVAETVVLCVQPGSGDSLQFMKAGIMEIPDIAVVTKADVGRPARQALSDLKGALSLSAVSRGRTVPQLAVSSQTGEGLDELIAATNDHLAWIEETGRATKRSEQAEDWLRGTIAQMYGEKGVEVAAKALVLSQDKSPFARAAELADRLDVTFRE